MGQMTFSGLVIRDPRPDVASVSTIRRTETSTATITGELDLTAASAVSATIGGVACSGVNVLNATQLEFTAPGNVQLGAQLDLVITADGQAGLAYQVAVLPQTGWSFINLLSIGQYSVPATAFPGFVGDGAELIGVSDQWLYSSKTSGTALKPGGYDVSFDSAGNLTITDPDDGVADDDPESVDIQLMYLDAQDSFTPSPVSIYTSSPSAAPPDTTPDQFDLGTDMVDAEPGTLVQRQFVLAGIDAGEFVTVQPTGSASVSPVSAQLGDTITMSLTSGAFGATVSGGVTINGVNDSISVSTRAAVVPAVSTQPVSTSVAAGQIATFSAVFTNAQSVQWYNASDDSAMPGETSAALQFTAQQSDNGATFYCVATSSDGLTVQTNTVSLTVSATNPTIVPVITPVGGTSITINAGAGYSDPAWTAVDDVGSVPVTWSGDTVDTATPGVYTRTAFATNSVGAATPVVYTVTVSASGSLVPTIHAPNPSALAVVIPADSKRLSSGHVAIQEWKALWSALDHQGNPAGLTFGIPSLMHVNDSPVNVPILAIDNEGRTTSTSALITITQLAMVSAEAVLTPGETERYEQKGFRYFKTND